MRQSSRDTESCRLVLNYNDKSLDFVDGDVNVDTFARSPFRDPRLHEAPPFG
jgi:hypothetical protein